MRSDPIGIYVDLGSVGVCVRSEFDCIAAHSSCLIVTDRPHPVTRSLDWPRIPVTLRGYVGHVMSATTQRRTVAEKVRTHRARLRAEGLRPLQIWVPDVRSATFRAEARQQSMAVASSVQAEEDQAFVDAVTDGTE